jgi:hypothetical protein
MRSCRHSAISGRITLVERWAGTRLSEWCGRGARRTLRPAAHRACERASAILADSRLVQPLRGSPAMTASRSRAAIAGAISMPAVTPAEVQILPSTM